MPRTMQAERIKGETVQPKRTLALLETVGVSKASRALGVSTTTLHKARKLGLVSKVIEVAADGELQRIGGRQPAHQAPVVDLLLLEIDHAKRPIVERLVRAQGGTIVAVD